MTRDLPPIPLRSWYLRNFKSVREADITLAHLNVLVGANSSGKSSLIQSILAASQAATAPAGSTFSLNGPQVRLGEFRDLLHANLRRGDITIGGALEISPEAFTDFDFDPLGMPRRMPTFRRARPETSILVTWRTQLAPGPSRAQSTAVVRGFSIDVEADGKLRSRAKGKLRKLTQEEGEALNRFGFSDEDERGFALGLAGTMKSTQREAPSEFRGASLRGGLPVGFLALERSTYLLADKWFDLLLNRWRPQWPIRREEPRTSEEPSEQDQSQGRLVERLVRAVTEDLTPLLDVPLSDAYRELYTRRASRRWRTLSSKELHEVRADFLARVQEELGAGNPVLCPFRPPEGVREASLGANKFLSQHVRYLGPLREDPQVVYRAAGSVRPGDIGPKGEFAAAVLHANAMQIIRMPDEDGNETRQTLGAALNFWLSRIGAAEDISTEDRGALGIYVRVHQLGLSRTVDLTSVGVGVSQLLPVLMVCLLSEPGDLLLLEQPELHLHPALQQELADFLLACAKSGRQLIVETHSEYLVSRLRKRIAADRSDLVLRATQFLFVERDPVSGASQYRAVPTNRYGGIEEWPRNFFAQTPIETQEILREGLRKSDDDETMVVVFAFTSETFQQDDHVIARVLDALALYVRELEGLEILLETGPLLPEHPQQEQDLLRLRQQRSPGPFANRRRAISRLIDVIGWRSGMVDELSEAASVSRVFVVRAVGIPLEIGQAVDQAIRAQDATYLGAYEFVVQSERDVFAEVESPLERRFSLAGGDLTFLGTDLSDDDVAGVVQSWRRARLFEAVAMGSRHLSRR